MMNDELNNQGGAAEAVAAPKDESIHQNGVDGMTNEVDSVAVDENAAVEGTIETPAETIVRLETELASVQAQAAEAIDRMQRTAADFQNTRRRQERLLQESLERATERLLVALLPVVDDFNLAFQNLPDTLKQEEAAWLDGFRRIHNKLSGILSDEGVTAIAPDGPFDPNRHEAVTHEPSEQVESGHIIATLRPGYVNKDRVLRPALVRVAQ